MFINLKIKKKVSLSPQDLRRSTPNINFNIDDE